MIQDIYKNARPLHLGVGLLAILALLSGCSSDDSLPEDTTGAFLQPVFHMSGVETRSIISGTSTTEGEGRINAVKLFVTKAEDGYTPYGGVGTAGNAGLSTFTYQSVGSGGNDWVGDPTVNLSNVKARIYAYSPANAILTKSTTTTTHTIATTLPVHQNFYGGKGWDSDATDYMYGSASNTVGEATAITASNTTPSGGSPSSDTYQPEIYLQHALARLSFTMQSATGRSVNATYDYVKKITLKTSSNAFTTGTGTMRIADGALGGGTKVAELTFTPKNDASSNTTAILCGAAGVPVEVGYGLVAPLSVVDMTLTVVVGKPGDATDDRRLSANLSQITWKRGHTHKIQITLSNRAISVSAGILPWTGSGSAGTGDVKPGGY
ncbi:hypothetical protein [Parabacteroides sp.]|uniref:hypothetical protein n=1 Tax=Parabacteroides sp. TaxID=1869337 RepID=UPI002579D5CD|nr:hypothetical protein [Parabacteroides sp.]